MAGVRSTSDPIPVVPLVIVAVVAGVVVGRADEPAIDVDAYADVDAPPTAVEVVPAAYVEELGSEVEAAGGVEVEVEPTGRSPSVVVVVTEDVPAPLSDADAAVEVEDDGRPKLIARKIACAAAQVFASNPPVSPSCPSSPPIVAPASIPPAAPAVIPGVLCTCAEDAASTRNSC